jgi:chemotaxis protein histidine kinase CheA
MTKVSPADKGASDEDCVSVRIRRAEAAIANLKANFGAWVKADIDSIGVHFEAAFATSDPIKRAAELEALRRIAHNIKGQGGTFGCHNLSEAAAALDSALKARGNGLDRNAVGGMVANLNAAYRDELA